MLYLIAWEVKEVVSPIHKEHLQSSVTGVIPAHVHLPKLAKLNFKVYGIPCENIVQKEKIL